MPVYSSTTKNWFHTHPLFTRSSDEGPSSSLVPPEIVPPVLDASDQAKLKQCNRPNTVNIVQGPVIQHGVMLTKKKKKKIAGVYM